MKQFTAKTVEEAVTLAANEFGVEEKDVVYTVEEEVKGLFKKSAVINVFEQSDAASFATEYLKAAIGGLGIEVETEVETEEDVIKITINSERNPVLIGKGGRTLQALNELTKLAVSNKFRHRYRILLDVGGYKQDKYSRVAHIAKRVAKQVQKTHVAVKLDPMTPDERRVVHNAITGIDGVKSESTGEGANRAVTIKYVG